MGATSVTGTGNGAAYGTKGPGNSRDQYVPLVSAHVVEAGTVTISGGTATVTFTEAMPHSKTHYAVTASAASGSTAITITKNDTSSKFVSFTITGANVDHDYVVVYTGHGA